MQAIIIQPDGTYQQVECTREGSYQTIKDAVGGWIEAVTSENGKLTFWCNEEGKLHGLEPNRAATYLWWATAPFMKGQDILVGPIVLTGGADPAGETLGLDDDQVTIILDYLED